MKYVHDNPDDLFDTLALEALQKRPEYEGTEGWLVTLHVPDEAVAAVIERWGPR